MEKPRIIRKPELIEIVGLSDPTIWRREKAGEFPKRISLGGRSVGWLSTEIYHWLEQQGAARDVQ